MEHKDLQTLLDAVDAAHAAGKIKNKDAVDNIRLWLTEPQYAEYLDELAEHIRAEKFETLEKYFWQIIPFGTGGRRGEMYQIGCNAINDRTIGESAQGLADFIRKKYPDGPLRVAIAYDTRHRSRHFAELCASIMSAAGFKVFFMDGFRSTPALSFAVRYNQCTCGIMVTASHNPPKDNAVKVYGESGGQMVPPDDKDSIEMMKSVETIEREDFQTALSEGRIVYCQEETDREFFAAVMKQSTSGPRDLKVIYSPLHGVGASAVPPVLAEAGFADVEIFGPHAESDPDFPNVPNNTANPENPRVFDPIIERAKETGAELIMATDPDCDRVGVAAPLTLEPGSEWGTLTGNQTGALLTHYLLSQRYAAGKMTPSHYVVKTLVTTELIEKIAADYDARMIGDLQVGFKWIGATIDQEGEDNFVFGAEESYGYLAGTHVRDKDAAVISMILAEYTAQLKSRGLTLHQMLDQLFEKHGCHSESQFSIMMPGASGMDDMRRLMGRLRCQPPCSLGGLRMLEFSDYLSLTRSDLDGGGGTFTGHKGDMVILHLEGAGNRVAIRPSGTEPKVKFYMFAADSPTPLAEVPAIKQKQVELMKAMADDIRAYAEADPDNKCPCQV